MFSKRVPSHVVSVFKSSDSEQIEYYSEDHQTLFDFCYLNKLKGQVVSRSFTYGELHLLRLMTPCIYRTTSGDFLSV